MKDESSVMIVRPIWSVVLVKNSFHPWMKRMTGPRQLIPNKSSNVSSIFSFLTFAKAASDAAVRPTVTLRLRTVVIGKLLGVDTPKILIKWFLCFTLTYLVIVATRTWIWISLWLFLQTVSSYPQFLDFLVSPPQSSGAPFFYVFGLMMFGGPLSAYRILFQLSQVKFWVWKFSDLANQYAIRQKWRYLSTVGFLYRTKFVS